jgi:hypothetical protein
MEATLSSLDYDPGIVSIGKKDAFKLALILNKYSPLKPMFDQVFNFVKVFFYWQKLEVQICFILVLGSD